jgi:hypothetical protein
LRAEQEEVMKRLIALAVSVALAVPGCAARGGGRMRFTPTGNPPSVSAYARHIPFGALVSLTLDDGRTIEGRFVRFDERDLVLQPEGARGEASIVVPVEQVVVLEVREPGQGKAIAIGVVAGLAGALGMLALIAVAVAAGGGS